MKRCLEDIDVGKRFMAIAPNEKRLRAVREDADHVFVYAPGKKRYGWRFFNSDFEKEYDIAETRGTEGTKRLRRIRRAINCLENSGLWSDKLALFKNMEKIEHEDWLDIKKLWCKKPFFYSSAPLELRLKNDVVAWANKINGMVSKYPFIKDSDAKATFDDGTVIEYPCINSSYVFEISECKLKSMYFGDNNEYVKGEISKAVKAKRDFACAATVSYDVSYEYDPKKNAAWYSEEYRGCGNGHYYIALDENTALFIEDD